MTEANTEGRILPIVAYGSPILKELCLETENKPEVQTLVQDLLATMSNIGTAVGLAAPQINSNLSVFVMNPDGRKSTVVINPIIKKRRQTVKSEEGCLSIPRLNAVVPDRDEIIDVEYLDENFNKKKMRLRGFEAIVFQHEYDHLNGILFTDRLTKEGREQVADRLADIEKGNTKSYYDMIFPGTDIVQVKMEGV